jgi:hypothetical protein
MPHRYPFLLVDRVLDFEEGRFLRAVKNVSVNEPLAKSAYQGNAPGKTARLQKHFLLRAENDLLQNPAVLLLPFSTFRQEEYFDY